MNRFARHLPALITGIAVLALLLHGPIPQLENYHAFADRRPLLGLPNAADVLSNIGFAFVGAWGLLRLWWQRDHPLLVAGWPGYRLFLISLVLTAAGSCFYHLAPDNTRLIFDRLPIALLCAGLLAAVHDEMTADPKKRYTTLLLSIAAILSVAWWYVTEEYGTGDLRPYLMLQALPLILIPLWLQLHHAPRGDKQAFGIAILLYIAAKFTELHDHEVLGMLGVVSGHTLKHLLATAAAAVVAIRLVRRTLENPKDAKSQTLRAPA